MLRKNLKNDSDYPLIMTRELAAEFIGVSGPTFDKHYRYAHNFPVVKNGDVEEAFPRDPIIKWIADNWQLLEKGERDEKHNFNIERSRCCASNRSNRWC